MNDKSRVQNVVVNMGVGVIFQVISLVLGFISRTIFIRILGTEYLGLNSLFTNILTILSFAELGIGNAIIFNMYKPIADGDNTRLQKLINFYKKTYFKIGFVILLLGILISPLLPSIINEIPNTKESIYLIYLLFLIDTSISYFFSYKTALITANQKNYIVVMYTYLFRIVQIIVQLIVLYFTKNYVLYLVLQLMNTFLTNLFLSRKATKMYPFLKNNKLVLEKGEQKNIFSNVKALFIYKFGSIILNGTDSIIISKMFGLDVLGLYSNYYLLLNAITLILSQVLNAFTSSIGNLIAKSEKEKERVVFYELYYFTFLLFGIIGICLYILFNDFVKVWLGHQYILSSFVVFSIVLHFYVNGVQFSTFTYRNTAGLFKKYKYASIIAVILNITLSVILGKYFGLAGVFLATSISRLLTSGIIDPVVVYKHILKENVSKYFIKYVTYLIIVIITYIITSSLVSFIEVSNIFTFILKGLVTFILTTILFILATYKTDEYKNVKTSIMSFFKRFRRN